jgi:hypothetical protein
MAAVIKVKHLLLQDYFLNVNVNASENEMSWKDPVGHQRKMKNKIMLDIN